MIENEYGSYRVTCDKCGKDMSFLYDTFQEAVEDMKRAEWVTRWNNGIADNICFECIQKENV